MTTEDQNLVNLALHGYAPRGLNFKCIDVDSGEFEILPLVRLNYEQDYATIGNHEFYFDELPLLWLHPIECLTKPITVEGYNDGKEFVPMEQIARIAIDFYDGGEGYWLSENIIEFEVVNRTIIKAYFNEHHFTIFYEPNRKSFKMISPQEITSCIGQFSFDLLNQWHIDWRGLIPKGLAVAITEI